MKIRKTRVISLGLILTAVMLVMLLTVSGCTPKQAETGDTVRVHYTGRLQNGEVFDTSAGGDIVLRHHTSNQRASHSYSNPLPGNVLAGNWIAVVSYCNPLCGYRRFVPDFTDSLALSKPGDLPGRIPSSRSPVDCALESYVLLTKFLQGYRFRGQVSQSNGIPGIRWHCFGRPSDRVAVLYQSSG